MRAEDDVRALGNFVDPVDEDRALLLQLGHDVDVVNDLLADVDGGTESLERLLDRDDGSIDPRAVSPGRSEQHPLGSVDRDILEALTAPRNAGHGHVYRGSAHRSDSTGAS